jgi:hypothetical protein
MAKLIEHPPSRTPPVSQIPSEVVKLKIQV